MLLQMHFIFLLFIFFLIYLFINFWLHWVFVAPCRLSLVVASGGYSSLQCMDFSLWWLLLLRSMGSRHEGFSSCGTRAQQLWLVGSRAQAQQLWRTGLVAPWHVGSSWIRDQTHVPCIGRWILNHCATREVLQMHFKYKDVDISKVKERKITFYTNIIHKKNSMSILISVNIGIKDYY